MKRSAQSKRWQTTKNTSTNTSVTDVLPDPTSEHNFKEQIEGTSAQKGVPDPIRRARRRREYKLYNKNMSVTERADRLSAHARIVGVCIIICCRSRRCRNKFPIWKEVLNTIRNLWKLWAKNSPVEAGNNSFLSKSVLDLFILDHRKFYTSERTKPKNFSF